MNKYIFKPYEEISPVLFENEKNRLSKYLTDRYRIEHVGSTAVQNLGGKGIIDMYIVVPKNKLKNVSNKLAKAGYEYRPSASTPNHLFLKIDLPDPIEETRQYHIHLGPLDSDDFKKAVAFRDYLCSHPKEAKRYAEIKKRAAKNADQDKNKYMKIKSPFMQEVLKKALE